MKSVSSLADGLDNKIESNKLDMQEEQSNNQDTNLVNHDKGIGTITCNYSPWIDAWDELDGEVLSLKDL